MTNLDTISPPELNMIERAIKAHGSEAFERLEEEMLSVPQVECGVRHMFAPGQYIREVTIPAGTCMVGHKHRFHHVNVFLKGSGTMIMCDGRHHELKAPMVFVGAPGRKVGYVKEEVVWLNIFNTDETDIDKIEELFFDKSDVFQAAQMQLLSPQTALLAADRSDYQLALSEVAVTEEQAKALSEDESDLIPFPAGNYKVKIGKSNISGKGLIATANIKAGHFICQTRIDGKRTPAGRYTNHSATPNARMVKLNGEFVLIALRPITGCLGGFDGEEITVNYRDVLALNLITKD